MKTKGLINYSWEVEHEINGSGELEPVSVRTARTNRLICDFEYSANSIEQDEEHAKLIASAPEMLGALKDCLKELDKYTTINNGSNSLAASNGRNAIKKATL